MAKRRKGAETPKPDALLMIARLLALIAIKGADRDEAALQLGAVGFDDKAIADLIGVSESYVRVVRFRNKRKKGKV